MALTSYNYDKTDTSSGDVQLHMLADEIDAAGLGAELSYIDLTNSTIVVWTDPALTGGQKTTLDGVVAAHSEIAEEEAEPDMWTVDATFSGYEDHTMTGDDLTKIEYYNDAAMTDLVYTKDFTYDVNDDLETIVITRASDSEVFTKTFYYSGGELDRIEYS